MVLLDVMMKRPLNNPKKICWCSMAYDGTITVKCYSVPINKHMTIGHSESFHRREDLWEGWCQESKSIPHAISMRMMNDFKLIFDHLNVTNRSGILGVQIRRNSELFWSSGY